MALVALYPTVATSDVAQFRAIALGNGARPTLETLNGEPTKLDWKVTPLDNGSIVNVGTAKVEKLTPDTEVTLKAIEGGQEMQRATVRTLPRELPGTGQEMRVVLLSCYCRLNPSSRQVEGLFNDLFRAYGTPHLKIWCGDQVYLDSPATHFLKKWDHTPAEIADNHLTHYVRTWSDDHLRKPLARGANVFTPDDHEFWNNAPYPNVVVPGLYSDKRRAKWTDTASKLLSAFQGVPELLQQPISVPPVSVLVMDTRSKRTPGDPRREFMSQADLARLQNWVKKLAGVGPGLLVLGQPIFQSPGDKRLVPRVFEDYSLADYEQFGPFLRILDAAPRDIAILSGDVHFTRAARMTLPSGRQIVEIINSPLALVVGLKRSNTKDAVGFPEVPGVGGIGAAQVHTDAAFQSGDDTAAVLSLFRFGSRVRVNVEVWRTADSPGATRPHKKYQFDLF